MLVEARKECGEGARVVPWRLHDLRRSCATGMASLGVQPHVIEAVLNHVSGFRSGVGATYNVFSYLPEKTEALAKWAAHVQGLVAGRRAPSRTRTKHRAAQ
jgi:hypothetical protein